MNNTYVSRFRSELELFSVVLMWGINFPLIKIILVVVPPHVLNVLRISSAGLVLGFIYFRRSKWSFSTFWAPLRSDPKAFILISFVGWIFYQVAFITGINLTSAGNAAIIMASPPVWTAILGRIMGVDRLSLFSWVGLLVSIAGTASIVALGTAEISLSSDLFLGNAFMLLAAAFWGFYTAMSRPMVAKHSPLALAVISLLIALPFLVIYSVPFWKLVDWSLVTPWYFLAIFLSGSLSTGVAIVFWNKSVQKLGASHTAAFNNLVPLIALFSSYFMLGSEIVAVQMIGGSLVIGGLVLMRWARRRMEKNEPIQEVRIL
jgi:drug/metabolite transporter (DMT)-like permease